MEEALNESCMNIPWTDLDGEDGREQLRRTAVELASAIASPYASPDMSTFPDYSKFFEKNKMTSTANKVNRSVCFDEPTINAIEENGQNMEDKSNKKAERKAKRKEKAAYYLERSQIDREKNAVLMEALANRKPVVLQMCSC